MTPLTDTHPVPLKKRITAGKKLSRITIPCSEDFRELVDRVAGMRGVTRAEFGFEAIIDHIKETIGEVVMVELHGAREIRKLDDFL